MIHTEFIQGSPEWLTYRAGKITASGICDMMAVLKDGGPSVRRAQYMAQVMRDRFALRTDPLYVPPRGYVSPAMWWGINTESLARSSYCLIEDVDCEQVGFVDHPWVPMSGCSPDGLIGLTGLVEFKCPETHNHIITLRTNTIDPDFIVQVQWQMACTGREWCDLVSFDPRLEPRFRFWRKRIGRDPDYIRRMEFAVVEFQKEVDVAMADLDTLYPEAA